MAKSKRSYSEENRSKSTKVYPSRFGSHKSMVNEDRTKELYSEDRLQKFRDDVKNGELTLLTPELAIKQDQVVCTDEFGDYITSKDRLDNNLADPNRYTTERIARLFSQSRKTEDK